jgi:hypothetical protein
MPVDEMNIKMSKIHLLLMTVILLNGCITQENYYSKVFIESANLVSSPSGKDTYGIQKHRISGNIYFKNNGNVRIWKCNIVCEKINPEGIAYETEYLDDEYFDLNPGGSKNINFQFEESADNPYDYCQLRCTADKNQWVSSPNLPVMKKGYT